MRLLAALVASFLPALCVAADLTVLAAASLRGPLDAAAADFTRASGVRVRIAYAGSAALARQAESGMPAGLFLSADPDWMDHLDRRGLLVPGTRADLLANDLVLVSPKDSAVTLRIAPGFALAAALGDGRLAMGQPASVPAGKYGKAALVSLGVWPAVERRVAGAEHVRAALALVARGEAALGIVYRTDALAEKGVRIVDAFPAGGHPPIVYPGAVLKGPQEAEGRRFLGHLRSAAGRAPFEKAGFRPAG